jgi:cell division septum initiation protein DivIVA
VSYLDDEGGLEEFDADEGADDDAESLLRQAIELVAGAKTMPLSSSILLSREEVLDLLEGALEALPEELKRARWVLADLDAMTEQRRREADALLEEVKAEAARLVSRTEIARQARAHAERVVADAEARGRSIIHEAEDFCDQRLAQMEIVLDRLGKTVQAGRERLRPRIESQGPSDADAEGDDVPFFDQDSR